jgi:predicted nucleotide-binding protein
VFLSSPLKKALQVMGTVVNGALVRDPRCVFVIHGRNERARKAVFEFLQAVGLSPIEWSQARALTGKPSPYNGEILEAGLERSRGILVLLTGDEEVRLRESFRREHERAETAGWQPRPNVLFEAGYAMARAPERTVLVELGALRPFSDIDGRHTVELTNSMKSRHELAARLRDAGCAVNTSGTGWHAAGDFDGAIRRSNGAARRRSLTSPA